MIEFQHVSKHYSSDAVALRDVSLTIAKGELVYLAGPSGAGKSTLLKMIAAMEKPTAGKVLVNGQDIGALKRAGIPFLRRNLGLIFQEQRLLNDRSVLANVMMPLLVTGAPRWTRWACWTAPTRSRWPSPAASSSAYRSRAPSSTGRKSSWPTSRPPTWTAPAPAK
jgi:ABC-type methionine transport system ATPase subunit